MTALDLNSPRWKELVHAYGSAADIPELLRQLKDVPPSDGESEPWFSLWSALAHQGSVYSASFAAVPHVVAAVAAAPTRADFTYFQFPAWIEICRAESGVPVPPDLLPAYREALAQLPALVAAATERDLDEDALLGALAAIAVSQGNTVLAEVLLELSADVAADFRRWLEER